VPLWLRYLLGAIVAALIAIFLSPVFPGPLDVIVYWLAWIAALILAVMAAYALFAGGRAHRL
jgi:multisubunit Na+/H+ antiporter MnhE subunit